MQTLPTPWLTQAWLQQSSSVLQEKLLARQVHIPFWQLKLQHSPAPVGHAAPTPRQVQLPASQLLVQQFAPVVQLWPPLLQPQALVDWVACTQEPEQQSPSWWQVWNSGVQLQVWFDGSQ